MIKLWEKIKAFANSNGFVALLALGLGIILWLVGYKIAAGISFGVFFTKNWTIIRNWLISKKILK